MTNEVLENMMTRRTIRRFKEEQISEEELQAVLDAGMYAPSAGGRQSVLFVVSQNREMNEKLGRIKRNNSTVKMSTDTVYISKEQPSIADDPNIFNAFYDAPTVITLFVPKNFLFAPYDASAAAENMLLAAHSIGLGGCYIGSAWESFADPYGQDVLREWNIRTDYFAALHVLLGYPKDNQAPKAKARKDGRIIRVN
ncbi:MAG: nitroreductase family protein [Lachnospiraceae bacterium]|nr:nitroreductase family protein [Lachnospiraceae bacterium]